MQKVFSGGSGVDLAALAPMLAPGSVREDAKSEVRSVVFGHLAGIVMAPTLAALSEAGVLALLESSELEWLDFDYIVNRTPASRGYLRVALRLLTGCGWLRHREEGRR